MLHGVNLAVTVTVAAVTVLAAVYLWSEDPGRRGRARELLKLLLRL
jgi:hypothetical protein